MALVATGQLHHQRMTPAQVKSALDPHFPGLAIGGPDYYLERPNCRVEFFCNNSSTLDFTVTSMAGSLPAPATVALLVREVESLQRGLAAGLSRRFAKARVQYCLLEDERSRSVLLQWQRDSPLLSAGAKLAYCLSVVLLVITAILVAWLLRQPRDPTRDYNLVSLVIAMSLPALTLPLPFVFEWLRARGSSRWAFLQTGVGA